MSNFNHEELKTFQVQFNSFDVNGDGTIEQHELAQILKNLGEKADPATVKALISEVDTDHSGKIEFHEFLAVIASIRAGKGGNTANFARVYEKQKEMIQVKGHTGLHSYAQEEMAAFAEHFNYVLKDDPDLGYLLPINPNGLELAEKVRDGVLLAKFINKCVKDTIDERALNKRGKDNKDMSLFKINENLNLVISSAKGIGVSTVNIGATELLNAKDFPHIILGLIWQLVKIQLLNAINLKNNPLLIRLLEDGEELADLMKLPPDQLLMRWMNYHLKNAGSDRRVGNWSADVKDSVAYTIVLNQISPSQCDKSALNEPNMEKRAAKVIKNAGNLGVPSIIQPRDISNGNSRLNLVFAAQIFNTNPGLEPLTEEEQAELAGLMNDDVGDSREERAFRMWMNTLGIPDFYINGLFQDCKDGLQLLRVMDFVEPGIVDWSKAEMKPGNMFKKLTNCNLAVSTGKKMNFSLVGIGGTDINAGNKKLVLALVWQLMRYHTIKFLSKLTVGGVNPTDEQIIEWANNKVAGAGRSTTMKNYKDKSLSTSLFFFDLLHSIKPEIINWELITDGSSSEDKLMNAKYAISVARKIGCTIFLLPEDIVEVKDKMIMTFVAAIMSVALLQDK
jgi:plastin-1